MGFMKRTLMFPSLQLKKENQTEIYWEHFGESTQGPGITQRVSQDLSTTFKHRAIQLTVCELENGNINSGFTHEPWWFSIVM